MGFLAVFSRCFYWVSSSIEEVFISGKKKNEEELSDAIEGFSSPWDVSNFYHKKNIKWRSDAKILGITLDHARKPWITYKKREGDCEDLMLLSEYILEKMGYKNLERWAINGKEWHAILVFPYEGEWGLFSNTKFVICDSKEKAIEYFYGKNHNQAIKI